MIKLINWSINRRYKQQQSGVQRVLPIPPAVDATAAAGSSQPGLPRSTSTEATAATAVQQGASGIIIIIIPHIAIFSSCYLLMSLGQFASMEHTMHSFGIVYKKSVQPNTDHLNTSCQRAQDDCAGYFLGLHLETTHLRKQTTHQTNQ